jgi:hypothetical protein
VHTGGARGFGEARAFQDGISQQLATLQDFRFRRMGTFLVYQLRRCTHAAFSGKFLLEMKGSDKEERKAVWKAPMLCNSKHLGSWLFSPPIIIALHKVNMDINNN